MVTECISLEELKENLNFLFILVKFVICYKRKGYNLDVIKQSACLAVNLITVDHFAYLFNGTPVGRGSDSMMARIKNYSLDGLGRNVLCLLGSPGFC